jgi:hypothetical protein
VVGLFQVGGEVVVVRLLLPWRRPGGEVEVVVGVVLWDCLLGGVVSVVSNSKYSSQSGVRREESDIFSLKLDQQRRGRAVHTYIHTAHRIYIP